MQVSLCTTPGGELEEPPSDTTRAPDAPDEGATTPTRSLQVRFANRTGRVLDVEFYASSEPLGNPDQVLFISENKVTEGIGFAGTGLVPPGTTDSITLACENARVIGTKGGRFVDDEAGEELGRGERRVAARYLQYECGDQITLVFDSAGEFFTTTMLIE
jgi:hypothetical protein